MHTPLPILPKLCQLYQIFLSVEGFVPSVTRQHTDVRKTNENLDVYIIQNAHFTPSRSILFETDGVDENSTSPEIFPMIFTSFHQRHGVNCCGTFTRFLTKPLYLSDFSRPEGALLCPKRYTGHQALPPMLTYPRGRSIRWHDQTRNNHTASNQPACAHCCS